MTISQTLVAGDTLSQDVAAPTDADGNAYAASAGWTLTYRLIPRSALNAVIELNAVADGDDYTLAAAAVDTAAWGAGWYGVAAYVTKGTETYTVEPAFAQVEILQNPRTAAAGAETRTPAQKAYDDACAALRDAAARAATVGSAGSATSGLVEYQIGDRRFKYGNPQEAVAGLVALKNAAALDLKRERVAQAQTAGLANPTHFYTRIGRA